MAEQDSAVLERRNESSPVRSAGLGRFGATRPARDCRNASHLLDRSIANLASKPDKPLTGRMPIDMRLPHSKWGSNCERIRCRPIKKKSSEKQPYVPTSSFVNCPLICRQIPIRFALRSSTGNNFSAKFWKHTGRANRWIAAVPTEVKRESVVAG